jgi:hypothetical protein
MISEIVHSVTYSGQVVIEEENGNRRPNQKRLNRTVARMIGRKNINVT